MSEGSKLPLKVVPPLERDFYRPHVGGGAKKIFTPVDADFRAMLSSQVIEVRDHFVAAFKAFPAVPAVARAKVRSDAVAKSHRPLKVLSTKTCPIIGAEGLGELLLSVTPRGLENLARAIETDKTQVGIANLSTLESFEAYQPSVEMPADRIAKVKLFRHNNPDFDAAVEESFYQMLRGFGIREPRELRYGRGLKIYKLELRQPELVQALSIYMGTQSVGPFPMYQPVRSAAVPVRSAVPEDFPLPEAGTDYPLIGVVDSGTAVGDPLLSPWRHAREVYVPEADQDNSHGSFVSGLIVHSRSLTLDDIYALHLHARLVVLSACSTGLGEISGDGVAGLSRAFFYAGSASVLTTLWDIADRPTAMMLPRFYSALQHNQTPSEALRTAQLSMLNDLRRSRLHIETLRGTVALPPSPVYWAGFTLSGEP